MREVAKLRKESSNAALEALNPDHTPDFKTFARTAVSRPLRRFFTEPIVFMMSVMSAVAFGMIYLFTDALPPIYQSMGFSSTSSTLPFLGICVGLVLGLLTRVKDNRTILKHEQNGILSQLELLCLLVGFGGLHGLFLLPSPTLIGSCRQLRWCSSSMPSRNSTRS